MIRSELLIAPLLAACLAASAAAEGKAAPAAPAPAPAAPAAPAVKGACTFHAKDAKSNVTRAMLCTEYVSVPDQLAAMLVQICAAPALNPMVQQVASGATGSWAADKPCDRRSAAGACAVDQAGIKVNVIYYKSETAGANELEQVKQGCATMKGTWSG